MKEPAEDKALADLDPIERPRRPSFPLSTAQLCVQCEHVYEGGAGGCPRCESAVGFSIARVIAPRDVDAPWRKAG